MCETVVLETFIIFIDKKLNMKKIDLIKSIAVKSNLKKEQIAIVVEGMMAREAFSHIRYHLDRCHNSVFAVKLYISAGL